MVKRRTELTFKDNTKRGRHGWVRLTPAYSLKMIHEVLAHQRNYSHVLDPFSGTGTTGLACAQIGIDATLLDINPFLVWLAKAKTANYSCIETNMANRLASVIVNEARSSPPDYFPWTPPIHNIHRWWSPSRLKTLAKLYEYINKTCDVEATLNILLVAFCRLVIDWSNASFNHQSISFRKETVGLFDEREMIFSAYINIVNRVALTAKNQVTGRVQVYNCDSRTLNHDGKYLADCVITSPPYANRMSYVRELRPYMYWLGYLEERSDAGELDWKAIGGTWGSATSRLNDWHSRNGYKSVHLRRVVDSIAKKSKPLANYVHKYIDDMYLHFTNIKRCLLDDADLFYIVGNSKFYDTLVSVEDLYARMMSDVGLTDVRITPIRKRNSKKELYEYIVYARNSAT